MNTKKMRRNLLLAAAVLCLCAANTVKVFSTSNVRNVDAVSLIGLGIAIAALIFNAVFYYRYRSKKTPA